MEKEDRERLVRVEVGITSLTDIVNKHFEASCEALGCSLHDDVMSLKGTQRTARRFTWTSLIVTLGVAGRYAYKGLEQWLMNSQL